MGLTVSFWKLYVIFAGISVAEMWPRTKPKRTSTETLGITEQPLRKQRRIGWSVMRETSILLPHSN